MPSRTAVDIIKERHFLTTTPEKSVRAVAVHMKENKEGAVLVVSPEDNRVLGICTERDLAFKVLAAGLDAQTTPVGSVMTGSLQTVGPETPFRHALHLMHEGGFRHMPVVLADGRPIGVLSARDALAPEMSDFSNELEQKQTLTELL